MQYRNGQKVGTVWVNHEEHYSINNSDVESIEIVEEPGMYCDIPHVAVLMKYGSLYKFCLHNIVGVEVLPQ